MSQPMVVTNKMTDVINMDKLVFESLKTTVQPSDDISRCISVRKASQTNTPGSLKTHKIHNNMLL